MYTFGLYTLSSRGRGVVAEIWLIPENKITVQKVIELVRPVDTERADIFTEPPHCESGDSTEDSEDEEMGGSLDNLSGHQ